MAEVNEIPAYDEARFGGHDTMGWNHATVSVPYRDGPATVMTYMSVLANGPTDPHAGSYAGGASSFKTSPPSAMISSTGAPGTVLISANIPGTRVSHIAWAR